MIKTFTVFAPQRSGTNFTEHLITANFKELFCHTSMNSYAWKHEPDAREVYIKSKEYEKEIETHLHLLVTKYIYKWIESIIRNPVDIVLRRKQLLDVSYCSSAEKLQIKNNMEVPMSWTVGQLNLIELVKLWNEFYKSWLEMGPKFRHWGIVKYESLLIQQQRQTFLKSMQQTYNLTKKAQHGWHLPISVPMSPLWNKSLSTVKSRDYLDLSTSYFLDERQVNVIDQLVDKDLLQQLGYPVEMPTSNLSS
jgi:hypothetical protein